MKQNVLSDPDVSSFIEGEFVLVEIDLTNRSGPNNRFAAEMDVKTIPEIRVYDSRGEFISRYEGDRSRGDFLRWTGQNAN